MTERDDFIEAKCDELAEWFGDMDEDARAEILRVCLAETIAISSSSQDDLAKKLRLTVEEMTEHAISEHTRMSDQWKSLT
jgi:hypothetical protein